MSKIRGWMLKQKTKTDTVWENRGIPFYSKEQHKIIHRGHGTNLVVEKKDDLWICFKGTSGKKSDIAKDTSRADVEKKCRDYMKRHPYGEKG